MKGVKVQHFFVCRLDSMDLSLRHGPEMEAPCGGDYDIVRVPFSRVGIAAVHLVPLSLRHYLDGNIEGVRACTPPTWLMGARLARTRLRTATPCFT